MIAQPLNLIGTDGGNAGALTPIFTETGPATGVFVTVEEWGIMVEEGGVDTVAVLEQSDDGATWTELQRYEIVGSGVIRLQDPDMDISEGKTDLWEGTFTNPMAFRIQYAQTVATPVFAWMRGIVQGNAIDNFVFA